MGDIFKHVTLITYALIVITWLYILIFYLKKINHKQNEDRLLNLLLIILTIDAFRTIFEGIYFGLRQSSHEGFIPISVFKILSEPQYVFLPKFITLITGVLVLIIVVNRWLPAEIK